MRASEHWQADWPLFIISTLKHHYQRSYICCAKRTRHSVNWLHRRNEPESKPKAGPPPQPSNSQCIMKERPASEGRGRMWRRLRCAALCRASLRYGGAEE